MKCCVKNQGDKMGFFTEFYTAAARAEIRNKSKKLAYKASKKSAKYKNAQIKIRKHLYNSIRTKHK